MTPKKPTKREMQKRSEQLEVMNLELKLTLENAQASFMENIYVLEELFSQMLEQAATIHEARRWFRDYKKALQTVPNDAPDHRQAIIDALAGEGFHIDLSDMPSGYKMLNDYQEDMHGNE